MTDASAGTAPPVQAPLAAVTQLRALDTRDDLERLLRGFYARALADPL